MFGHSHVLASNPPQPSKITGRMSHESDRFLPGPSPNLGPKPQGTPVTAPHTHSEFGQGGGLPC
jgi:hypothetical protein